MRRRWKWLIPVLVLLLGALAWHYWPEDPLKVAVAAVANGPVEQVVANTRAGTVKACRRSKLSMPMGGRVERLHVHEGDRVRDGAVLLELWNDDREAGVAQARAALDTAAGQERQACITAEQGARDADRVAALWREKLVSADAVDQAGTRKIASSAACAAARGQTATARAALRLQEALLEETRLRAPFAGVVAEINGEIGEYVTPSPPGVMTPPAVDLIDDGCLYVTAPIDEVDAAAVKPGQPARITLDAFRGRAFAGRVERIAPYVVDKEKQARTVDIDVRFVAPPEDIDLLAGYSADVEVILANRENVLRLPAEAIIDGRRVYVLDAADSRLHSRDITLGLSNWNWAEVTAGLVAGERVVTSPDRVGIADGVLATAETPVAGDAATP